MKTLARIILFGGNRVQQWSARGHQNCGVSKKPHLAAIKFAKFQIARVEHLAYSLPSREAVARREFVLFFEVSEVRIWRWWL